MQTGLSWQGMGDLSLHEQRRRRKLEELVGIQHYEHYEHTTHYYMAYLSNYLDDINGYSHCGAYSNCDQQYFPHTHAGVRIRQQARNVQGACAVLQPQQ